ncbi:MAG: hypothetical protein PHH06_03620 [Candidatus Gracilibacteria bacterium]|nr:hypothetical protein [Candidatus Gracilibacteria bacterium]
MLNPIYFLLALSGEMINEEVMKKDKCEIFGTIKKIEITNDSICLDKLEIYVLGNKGKYIINSLKTTENGCEHDGIGIFYGESTLPKVGDKINYLIDKDNFYILSDKKDIDGTYHLESGDNLRFDIEVCKANSSFIEFHKDFISTILYFMSFIILILIIGFIRFSKSNNC